MRSADQRRGVEEHMDLTTPTTEKTTPALPVDADAAPAPIKKARRGFAAMSPEKQKEIASKGGKAAHVKGTAHEFNKETARAAGRKGGLSARRRTTPQPTVESRGDAE